MNASANGFSDSGGGRSWVTAMFLVVYVSGFLSWAFLTRMKADKSLIRATALPALLVVLSGASIAWSVAPLHTSKQTLVLAASTMFCLCMYARMGFIGSMDAVRVAIMVLGACSVVAVLAVPELAISYENHEGSWKGVFAHKNTLGAVSGLGVLLWWCDLRMRVAGKWRSRVAVLFLLTIMVMSGSLTALLVSASASSVALVWWWAWRLRIRGGGLVMGLALMVGGGLLVSSLDLEALAEVLGRDASATGRVPLWGAVWSQVLERPWLGYGYAAYWEGIESGRGPVSRAIGFFTTHPHNGYLELMLSFGAPLALLIVSGMLVQVARGASVTGRSPSLMVAVGVLAFIGLFNMTETAMLASHGLFWTSFTLCAIRIADRRNPGAMYASVRP